MFMRMIGENIFFPYECSVSINLSYSLLLLYYCCFYFQTKLFCDDIMIKREKLKLNIRQHKLKLFSGSHNSSSDYVIGPGE